MLRNRTKHIVNVTGTLANVLVPGMPALYLYEGQCIRTAVVKSILEVSTDYVRFETSRRIYNIYEYIFLLLRILIRLQNRVHNNLGLFFVAALTGVSYAE